MKYEMKRVIKRKDKIYDCHIAKRLRWIALRKTKVKGGQKSTGMVE